MANKNTEVKDKEVIIEKPATLCQLKSKANYTIPIRHKKQNVFIPPFGSVTVTKEDIEFNSRDARYLTFIKI